MVPSALAFACGILCVALQSGATPASAILTVAVTGALSAMLLWRATRRSWWRGPLWFCLGLLWAQLAVDARLAHPFPEALLRHDLTLVGRIASVPTRRDTARRFLFDVEQAFADARPLAFHGRVRLTWYRNAPPLSAGARWRLTARLKPPHGFANPGGVDYERLLFAQGVMASGYVRERAGARLLDPAPGRYWLSRWRQGLAQRLDATLADHPGRGLVMALTLGVRDGLTPADWRVLARTGTSHLVAISGLHIGLIAGVVFWLVSRLWPLAMRLAEWLATPRAAALAAWLAALLYAALAGFALPTRRALIMLALVLAALFWARTPRPWQALALALLSVLVLDPLAVLGAGFWLSFGAVAALLFALTRRLPLPDHGYRWGHRWWRAQWAVGIGLAPLLLLLFGQASVIAPAVNLLAIPLLTLALPVVLGAALANLTLGIEAPLHWCASALDGAFGRLGQLAQLPWAAWTIGELPSWAWCAALLGAALLLAPRGLPGRWLGLVLLAPLLMLRPPAPGRGELWLEVLDVGQGLAVVARTASHTLVYDTGPGYPSGFNTGSAVVAPFLRSQGIRRIDSLVLSHADNDHVGGLGGLLAELPVGRLLSGEPERVIQLFGSELAAVKARVMPCRAGMRWQWSGVRFQILWPTETANRVGNDASCVLRIETATGAVLLTGDVSRKVEHVLLAQHPARLSAGVLIAGHHGSNTSSSAAFLDAVDPSWALISAGYANRYGFPAKAVRERLFRRGITWLETAQLGAIQLRLPTQGAGGPPLGWRVRHPRWWRHRPSDGSAATDPR